MINDRRFVAIGTVVTTMAKQPPDSESNLLVQAPELINDFVARHSKIIPTWERLEVKILTTKKKKEQEK